MSVLEFQHYPIDVAKLPQHWSVSSISELDVNVQSGFPTGEHNKDGRGIPHIRPMNIDRNGTIDLTEVKYVAPETNGLRLQCGDVLFNNTNSPELIGKTAAITQAEDWAFSNHMTRLRFSSAVDFRFAAHQLHFLWMVRYFRHRCVNHVNQASISGKPLSESVPFVLAPLNEQQRIVAKIEELFSDLDAGVAALKRAKANLKRYRAAVLKAAVEGKLTEAWRAEHPDTEPASKLLARILTERRQKWEADQLAKFAAAEKEPPKNWREKYIEPTPPATTALPELPEGWRWAKLDQLITYLRNGYFQSPTGAESGTPILRINAVRPMSVDLAETRFLDEIEGSVNDFFIENDDLLFTRYNGSIELLGVAGMVRGCTEKVLHPDKLIRVRMALGEPMPSFVEIAANVGASRKHMVGRARTTAGQTGISGPDVREMPIPLPPLDEQNQIVAEVAEKLSQIEAAETAINHDLLRAARLRQSILKQAFEGKLVPQDPTDEPASVLLDRIRQERCKMKNGRQPRQRTQKANGSKDEPNLISRRDKP